MNKRLGLLDTVRGLTLLSMIAYHGAWDLVYLYGIDWNWYRGTGAYVWQQSICWTFILLSGFCWPMGRKPLKRGLIVFGGGLLVTAVTLLFMPANRVVFGILTLLGSAMLLMIPLDKILKKVPPEIGFLLSFFCFVMTRNINRGTLGFEAFRIFKLPQTLYHGTVTAYLGFPARNFYSTDYFSLIPWIFLFVTGYFLYHFLQKNKILDLPVFTWDCGALSFIGRHSLLIYLLHQPLLYVVFACLAPLY